MINNNEILIKLYESFSKFENAFNIIEEPVDNKIQQEYFDYPRKNIENFNIKNIIKQSEKIFKKNTSIKNKKEILIKLALSGDIKACRIIQKYLQNPDESLKDWAKLALKENQIIREGKILNEARILIHSPLGGKGLKIRYSGVFILKTRYNFDEFEKKIINNELEIWCKKHHSEIEEIQYINELCIFQILIPIFINVHKMIKKVVDEINVYGNFIFTNYLISNQIKFDADYVREILDIYYKKLK